MNRSVYSIVIAVLAVAVLHGEPAFALADGYYDSTWLNGGRTRFQGDEIGKDQDFPPGSESLINRIFVGSSGELLLFGTSSTDTWIGGMHPDGSWILTFGPSNGFGRSTSCYLGFCNRFVSAAVQPDGNYTVLGESAFERVTALATSWTSLLTTASLVIDNVGGHVDATGAVAVQPDGKVLVAGSGYTSGADTVAKFGIARFGTGGFSVDPAFNNSVSGEVTYSGGAVIAISAADSFEAVTDILVQPDGRIVLVGFAVLGELNSALELTRLNNDGSIDSTFGNAGVATFTWPLGAIVGVGRAILDRAGRIVVALQGELTVSNQQLMLVARVTSAGELDSKFGQDAGFSRFSESGACTSIFATAVAVDSAGRVLVVGDCITPALDQYFIAIRLRGDTGYFDGSFGISGYGLGAFAASDRQSHGRFVVFDSSGRPIVGGQSGTEAGIARLTYDLIRTDGFELAPRGCLPPDCN